MSWQRSINFYLFRPTF